MKIALISGASSGIGRALACALAAGGEVDELWLLGRHEERLRAVAATLGGAATRILPLDLMRAEAFDVLRGELSEAGGHISWLVAAAGVGYMGEFAALSEGEMRETVTLNCIALSALIETALPYMARGSHILTLASAAALLPQPGFAVYAASKAYVLSLSRALGRELRERGITVTAVCPGPVDTPFLETAARHAPMPRGKKKYVVQPAVVVRAALRGAKRGRAVVLPTAAMKLAAVAAKLLPHGLLVRFFR